MPVSVGETDGHVLFGRLTGGVGDRTQGRDDLFVLPRGQSGQEPLELLPAPPADLGHERPTRGRQRHPQRAPISTLPSPAHQTRTHEPVDQAGGRLGSDPEQSSEIHDPLRTA